jgi:hypothetical protein
VGVQGGPVCRWATVIENLEDLNVDEVISQFDVTHEQVEAVLKFVAEICAPKSRPVLPLFDHCTPKGLSRGARRAQRPHGASPRLGIHSATVTC